MLHRLIFGCALALLFRGFATVGQRLADGSTSRCSRRHSPCPQLEAKSCLFLTNKNGSRLSVAEPCSAT